MSPWGGCSITQFKYEGELDADRPVFANVRFADTGRQLLKVSNDSANNNGSDQGVVQASLFEYTAGKSPGYLAGGISANGARSWAVHDSEFRGINSPDARLAGHAIHFWANSAHTVVERNRIYTSEHGIGFGLSQQGHVAGIIRNNMISVIRDVGIGLENSPGTLIANNTVVTKNYPSAIEYRFPGTRDGVIQNNLTNTEISGRNSGMARLRNNFTEAKHKWFKAPNTGDLHLIKGIPNLIDTAIITPQVAIDADCEPRPNGASADLGADETQLTADPSLRVETASVLSRDMNHAWKEFKYRINTTVTHTELTPLLVSIIVLMLLCIYVLFHALHIHPNRGHENTPLQTIEPSQEP